MSRKEVERIARELRMEELIQQYVAAIVEGKEAAINEACEAVEAYAKKIGYSNHARLMTLHTSAERVLLTGSFF